VRKEVADLCSDLLRMGLERKVAGVEETNRRTGNVASERLGPLRQKERIGYKTPMPSTSTFWYVTVLVENPFAFVTFARESIAA
jgi:hypothetical protein